MVIGWSGGVRSEGVGLAGDACLPVFSVLTLRF